MMKCYLAGGVNGKLGRWFWVDRMGEDRMDLHLVGNDGYVLKNQQYLLERVNLLESFYYIKEWQIPLIHKVKSFMLDSGAFSFMQNPKSMPKWDEYVERYGNFIKDNHIGLFYELDIDSIIGYKDTIRLRDRLESITGKQCIPVWHKSRGKQAFIDMCRDYDYVSIGGIVSGEIARCEYKIFNPLCDIAHDHGAKIHGLGFTNTDLATYKFDSVDSTAWIYGNRGGYLYHFTGSTITKINCPQGHRLKSREVAIHNFWEWVKYGEFLESIGSNPSARIHQAGAASREYVLLPTGGIALYIAASKSEKRIFI